MTHGLEEGNSSPKAGHLELSLSSPDKKENSLCARRTALLFQGKKKELVFSPWEESQAPRPLLPTVSRERHHP